MKFAFGLLYPRDCAELHIKAISRFATVHVPMH